MKRKRLSKECGTGAFRVVFFGVRVCVCVFVRLCMCNFPFFQQKVLLRLFIFACVRASSTAGEDSARGSAEHRHMNAVNMAQGSMESEIQTISLALRTNVPTSPTRRVTGPASPSLNRFARPDRFAPPAKAPKPEVGEESSVKIKWKIKCSCT